MSLTRTTALGVALTAALLTGCATTRQANRGPGADRACVQTRNINSFTSLDDSHVFVSARARDHYVFTVDELCRGLRFAQRIAIANPSMSVCGDGFNFLVFDDPAVGPKRCRILDITPVEDIDAARKLVETPED